MVVITVVVMMWVLVDFGSVVETVTVYRGFRVSDTLLRHIFCIIECVSETEGYLFFNDMIEISRIGTEWGEGTPGYTYLSWGRDTQTRTTT